MPLLANLATRFAGLMALAIGIAHFFMPSLGYAPDDLAAIPAPQRAHFVFLGTYAIAFFLLAFAVMTLLANRETPSPLMTVFLGLMVVVWPARLILELIYPVELFLFFTDDPHPLLLTALALICAAYLIGFALHLRASVAR